MGLNSTHTRCVQNSAQVSESSPSRLFKKQQRAFLKLNLGEEEKGLNSLQEREHKGTKHLRCGDTPLCLISWPLCPRSRGWDRRRSHLQGFPWELLWMVCEAPTASQGRKCQSCHLTQINLLLTPSYFPHFSHQIYELATHTLWRDIKKEIKPPSQASATRNDGCFNLKSRRLFLDQDPT